MIFYAHNHSALYMNRKFSKLKYFMLKNQNILQKSLCIELRPLPRYILNSGCESRPITWHCLQLFPCIENQNQILIIYFRSSKKTSGSSFLSGTKSLGRSAGLQYLRQGDAVRNGNDGFEEDWDPEQDAKATTLSRDSSGRGSIRFEQSG